MPSAVKPSFGRVALVGKLGSPEIASSLRELVAFLKKRGCETFIEKETAAAVGERGLDYEAIGAAADLAVVIGGDGTLLAAARNLVRHRVPVVGIMPRSSAGANRCCVRWRSTKRWSARARRAA